ncbi:MAG: hypothetical protein ABSC03_06050 [Verrucomicrobiota bacterium]
MTRPPSARKAAPLTAEAAGAQATPTTRAFTGQSEGGGKADAGGRAVARGGFWGE